MNAPQILQVLTCTKTATEQAARMLPAHSPKCKALALSLLKRHLAAAGIRYTSEYDAPLLLGDGRAVYRAAVKVNNLPLIRACWIQ